MLSLTLISRCVWLAPSFSEKDVDHYFEHFEEIALSLKWPRHVWSMLVSSVLKSKAQEAYNSLSVEQSADYDALKSAVLKAYRLIPEAYRQKFRNARPDAHQTYLDFAREKALTLNKCLSSI